MESALADIYRRFARREVNDQSPCHREWGEGVAHDLEALRMINELPGLKRQPQLVFAAAGQVGIAPGPYRSFRTELMARWEAVRRVVLARRTQTNEPGRCAALLPLLAAFPQPLALLEVGASAGLCLYPDRYSYQYGDCPVLDPEAGPSGVKLTCATDGDVPIPRKMPRVVCRAGLDLNPLDVTDPEDMRWLDVLIWPGQDLRRERLAAAIAVVRSDPPRILRGDLKDGLEELAKEAPAGATLVVFHSAVMTYLEAAERAAFVATVSNLRGHWLSLEGPSVAPLGGRLLPPSPHPTKTLFVVESDGVPVAFSCAQGQSLHWIR